MSIQMIERWPNVIRAYASTPTCTPITSMMHHLEAPSAIRTGHEALNNLALDGCTINFRCRPFLDYIRDDRRIIVGCGHGATSAEGGCFR